MASIWDLNVDDHHNANGDDDNLMEVLQKKWNYFMILSLSWGGVSPAIKLFSTTKQVVFGPKTLFQALFSVF